MRGHILRVYNIFLVGKEKIKQIEKNVHMHEKISFLSSTLPYMYLKSYSYFTNVYQHLPKSISWSENQQRITYNSMNKTILTDCFLSACIKFINFLLIFIWNLIILFSVIVKKSLRFFGMWTTKTATHVLQLPCFEIYLVLQNETTLSLILYILFSLFIFCQSGFDDSKNIILEHKSGEK